ncbi:MAG: hypothetical protein WDO74_14520 [Pseudomonadota bacterium]
MNAHEHFRFSFLLLCLVACQSESNAPSVIVPEGAVAPFAIDDGGYVRSGRIHGYARTWGSDGTLITPAEFLTVVAGSQLCAAGTLPADPTYRRVAQLGFKVNQEQQGPDTLANTIALSGNGIRVSVTNRGKSPLRVALSGANAESDGHDWWCAALPSDSAVIPWSAFNSACWDGSGAPYAGQPLREVAIVVPSSQGLPVSFDFCLDDLADASATDATPETIDQFIKRTIAHARMPGDR